ncbi:MAG: hypothetical protein HY827_02985 [Actinobacteria bacterium]|nr:hypothetical protein [Actinomycetota bacterium]
MIRTVQKTLLIAALCAVGSLFTVTGADAATGSNGQTRVIVTLAVPESAPDAQTAVNQATNDLLAALPAGDYTVVNRPTVLPYLTLSVGTSAMSVLQSSGLVASIERDATVSASSSKGKRARHCKKVTLRDGSVVRMCKKTRTAV